jgi:uncharacterized protein YukE
MDNENKTIGWAGWSEKIVRGLRKSADDIEKFSLKAKLGSMELMDLFERNKKEIKTFMENFTSRIKSIHILSQEQKNKIQRLISEINIQLALGKAETREAFQKQYSKISKQISRIKKMVDGIKFPSEIRNQIELEMKKIEIKLNILKLRYESKKMQENFR